MPQVPYKPVPTVTPTQQGPGPISVRTPQLGPDVWGANVGQAISHLGTTVEGAGTEMFDRAMAFQNLDNHNNATMAAAEFEKVANKMDVDLKMKEGKGAVDAYDGYDDRMEQARLEIRNRLGSEDAKKIFDSQSKGIFNKAVWAGGLYAADQHKVWTHSVDQVNTEIAAKQVKIDPNDDTVFQKGMDAVKAQVQQTFGGRMTPDQLDEKYREVASTTAVGALIDYATANPLSAKTKLDAFNNQGLILHDDYVKAKEKIDAYINERVPPNIVKDMLNGTDWRMGNQKVSIDRAGNAMSGTESTDNYSALGPWLTHKVNGQMVTERALGRYQVMQSSLQGMLKEAGMAPMTEEEFLKDHTAQDRLFNTIFQKYMDKYGSANEAASVWFTGTTMKNAIEQGRHDVGTSINGYLSKFNANLAKGAKEEEFRKAAMDKGKDLVDDNENPLFPQHLQTEVNRQISVLKEAKRDARFEALNTLGEATSTVGPDGKLPVDKDKILADPRYKAAYDTLDKLDRISFARRLARNAHDVYPPEESNQRFTELMGMAQYQAGRDELRDMDLMSEHISPFQRKQLMTVLKDPNYRNEPLEHAYKLLSRTMPPDPDTGLGVPTSKQKDRYNRFNGELSLWLEQYQNIHNKFPDEKAIKQVGQEMLRGEAVGYFSGRAAVKQGMWSTTVPMYQVIPPEDAVKRFRALPGHEHDSDEQVRRYFVRDMLIKATEGTAKTGKPPGPPTTGGGG